MTISRGYRTMPQLRYYNPMMGDPRWLADCLQKVANSVKDNWFYRWLSINPLTTTTNLLVRLRGTGLTRFVDERRLTSQMFHFVQIKSSSVDIHLLTRFLKIQKCFLYVFKTTHLLNVIIISIFHFFWKNPIVLPEVTWLSYEYLVYFGSTSVVLSACSQCTFTDSSVICLAWSTHPKLKHAGPSPCNLSTVLAFVTLQNI